ncbi:hypothetical protein, partial [Erwinia tasmaniensis]|uniref:hypothetical protein n=1 Tax=Erwinia tasmaniensis TaxID=338565 RepID=UPI003A4E3BF9
ALSPERVLPFYCQRTSSPFRNIALLPEPVLTLTLPEYSSPFHSPNTAAGFDLPANNTKAKKHVIPEMSLGCCKKDIMVCSNREDVAIVFIY